MKFIAITAEYNPLHNGHIYHVEKSKLAFPDADFLLVAQSGDFTQRGEVAIANKYLRAKTAVLAGADIVVELPTIHAVGCAEIFAKGAIQLFSSIKGEGVVSFGCEEGNLNPLFLVAKITKEEPLSYKNKLQELVSLGVSYPKAKLQSLKEYAKENNLVLPDISLPNNILAIEYLKAMADKENLSPFAIKRIGDYHGIDNLTPSSSYLRSLSKENLSLGESIAPAYSIDLLKSKKEVDLSLPLLYKLRSMSKEDLAKIADVSEGLENRILNALDNSYTYQQLLENVSTKRYTKARISRILTCALLDITKESQALTLPYYNVLAIRKGKEKILSLLSQSRKVFTSQKEMEREITAKWDVNATNLYGILQGEYKEKGMVYVE